MATSWPKKRRLIGSKNQRLDGPAKATGKAKYSYDINRKGMLHAVMLRSPHAHAKIKSIDTADAEKMPGVRAIHVIGVGYPALFAKAEGQKITVLVKQREQQAIVVKVEGQKLTLKVKQDDKEEEKTVQIGLTTRILNQGKPTQPADLKAEDNIVIVSYAAKSVEAGPGTRLFKEEKVAKPSDLNPDDQIVVKAEKDAIGRELFYAGDEILALAADTEEHALDAVRAVKIEYEVLAHLVKEEDGLKQDPQTVSLVGGSRNNILAAMAGASANFEMSMAGSAVTVEGSYGVPTICHQCLESHGLVAEWGKDGGLTVWASTQAVWGTATELARHFAIPNTKVKCITHYMGGGFGSKFGPDIQGIVAAELARQAKAPVKLMLDRASEITAGGSRPSAFGKVKVGATKDGKVTAYEVDCYGTAGIQGTATVTFNALPYVYPFVYKRKHTRIRTNTQQQRAMRAPNHPQNCTLTEFILDDLAAKLDMDPMQLRLKNLPQNDPNAVKNAPHSLAALRNTIYTREIEIAAGLSKWKDKWHPPGKTPGVIKHGIGMALHTWGGQAAPQRNECTITITADGSVTASTSTQDLGTGQRTVTALITAEILGLEPQQITLRFGESDLGASSGSGGSTTIPSQAPATLRAATAVRDDLFAKIAPKLDAKAENLVIELGKVRDTAGGKTWNWKQACAALGGEEAKATGFWTSAESMKPENKDVSSSGVGGVQIAEVMVDTETGVVRCTQIVAVQDCGLVVNPLTCESQVAGGVIMGLNYALFEERIMDRVTGRQVNSDMEFYKLGGIEDMPKIIVHLHDMPERGVIGVGEPPVISTHAAIGNAIFNAIGARVPHTPFTPERVLAALAAKGGKG